MLNPTNNIRSLYYKVNKRNLPTTTQFTAPVVRMSATATATATQSMSTAYFVHPTYDHPLKPMQLLRPQFKENSVLLFKNKMMQNEQNDTKQRIILNKSPYLKFCYFFLFYTQSFNTFSFIVISNAIYLIFIYIFTVILSSLYISPTLVVLCEYMLYLKFESCMDLVHTKILSTNYRPIYYSYS